ncbi:MAG: ABC transporter permease [Treponema sp.]|jgi:putative ABC transport system permease protein|nr:ABC transporter permease [Treponema sp.]
MNRKPLSTGALSLKNLKNKRERTLYLAAVVSILAFILFGGAILAASLQTGMESMNKRLGADILVVPDGYAAKARAVLLRGEPNYFYFDKAVAEKVSQTDGVACASPQFFLSSLSEACCDSQVQLIGFDPETDFVIQPWIAESSQKKIGDGEIVIGSAINARSNNTVRLLGHEYPVAARLSPSATGFDTSIFMNMNTMQFTVYLMQEKGYNLLSDQQNPDAISSVLVRLQPGASTNSTAFSLRKAIPGVEVVTTDRIMENITGTITKLISSVLFFALLFWILAAAILQAVFSGIMNERKKEFAVLRILGASRKKLIALVLSESLVVSVAGGLAGTVLAAIVVFPFSSYIGHRLNLPYLFPNAASLLIALFSNLALSFIIGPLASFRSALKISRAETWYTMREGE